jgi:streptogramin lyase
MNSLPWFSAFRIDKLTVTCALFAALACTAATTAVAQTITFDGAQRPVAFGFYEPESLAVDQYGNLFVADADTFTISEILATNGAIPPNPTIRVLYRDTWNPEAIAVDKNGNVFFADYNDENPPNGQTIKEILAVGGSIPASPTVVQLGGGFSFPQGLSVDANGDVFVADYYKNTLFEMLAVDGSVPPSPMILPVGSGFSNPSGIAMDALGNIYIADSGNHAVKEILAVNGSIPPSPAILTLAANYCSPSGVSLDSQGNLYFSDYCNAAVYQILAVNGTIPASPVIKTFSSGQGLSGVSDVAVDSNQNVYVGGVYNLDQIPQVYPSDFGPVRVGTTTGVTPFMFTFIGPVTLGSVSVVPQSAGGMDFANAGTGTCVAGTTYSSPSAYSYCTVTVTFTPRASGTRSGAVLLKDTSGNTIATGYMHGTGVAPLVNFAPPVQSAAVSSVSGASGVAIDANGNLYIAATGQNQILKETFSGGSYVQSVIPTSALNAPRGVAVDSAGDIYIADTGNNRVLKETPAPTGFKETTVDTAQNPVAVTVDQDGHFDIVYGNGVFTGFRIDGYLGTGVSRVSGVAVDTSDNLYIVSGSTPGSILKETLSGANYVSNTIALSGLDAPAGISGISVDGFGNLYVSYTDSNSVGQVVKLTPSSGGYIQSAIATQGLSQPAGLAVDPSGNIFIADSENGRIVKVDSSDPPSLSFASTLVGSTSTDSPQTVTLQNIGNADLTLPIPATGNNPSIAAGFSIDSNAPSACPLVGSGASTPGTIPAGTSCELPITFSPIAAGSITGSLTLTDNNLNANAPGYATQSITLNGTATQVTPVITWPTPVPITYGTPLSAAQLNSTANVGGTFAYSPSLGSVLAAGQHTLTVTFTPTDTTSYTAATASVILTVNKATPVITWPTPAPITYGTPLSSKQLNATANLPGTFVYTPPAGTVLPVGVNIVSVAFTPTDSTDYNTAGTNASVTVNPAPGFTLSSSPSSLSVKQGNSTSTTVSIKDVGGFTGKVSLSVSNLPSGVSASFSKNPATGNSTLTLSADNKAATGTTTITITGTSGKLTQTTTISLTVNPRR